ncbi:MAG: MSHA biogenesis protein MshQ [Marinobacter excellens HL-55]|uniref:MSHA biogenesis protein MshQ n=1 Tax=Marinobacter excellens HL-55 TaxID=1305731 RepID=A0A0P7YCH8_9GAMM|nr:MAG: MSHA biogenesis protein MshQ [Marinobacter excellens HL-55]
MTEAVGNQSTAATLQREIPGAENLVVLEFDYYAYGGNGADGIAVVLSDAAITPQPGSFGGSLGYAQRNNGDAGFAGGWLGIGIDEFGNFSAEADGRQGGVGQITDSVSIRGSGSGADGYRYLAGTGTLSPGIDSTGPNNPHRYRITVDSRLPGQAIVAVERNTGSGFEELIAPFDVLSAAGQAAVPENFLLSLTGSTGDSSNIHELDELQLCALKLNPVGVQVDHFEIDHDGVALTCQPETVTIRACADADCNQLFSDPVTATLAPEDGWVGGNVVSITGGAGTVALQKTVAGPVTLNVVGSQPSTRPQSQTLCRIGNGPLAPGNCTLSFVDSGLAFEVPDLKSHRPSGPVQIRAVRRDDETQACVPAFENVSKKVEFWSTYVSPGDADRPASRLLEIDEIAIGNGAASSTEVDLNFGAGGMAEIDVVYPDAGQMQLNALYSGSEATGDAGLIMPGADSFVSVPAGFCVSADSSCPQGDDTCPLFRRAGESFDLTITAAGWQSDADVDFCVGNPVTPNFELSGIPLLAELVAPADGEAGTIAPGSYDHVRSVDAETTVPVNHSEVGVFRFLTNPVPGAYLGRDLPPGRSVSIGRFYPDRFRVMVDPGAFEAECGVGQFTYSGQPFGWLMTPTALLEPLSVQGVRTRNYTSDGFRRLSVAGVSTLAPDQDAAATDINGDLLAFSVTQEAATLTVQEPGLMLFSFNLNDQFEYTKSSVTRVEPFKPELVFVINSVQDDDGVQAEAAPYEFEPKASFEIRYGRLIMENVYGPETVEALFMPFRVESFDGGRFVTHVADSCTGWTAADIDTTGTHHVLVSDSGTFDGGTAGPLRLEPVGTQGTDLLTWDVPKWLEDDWGNEGALRAPSATATFGVYRGNDRIIYWREVLAN